MANWTHREQATLNQILDSLSPCDVDRGFADVSAKAKAERRKLPVLEWLKEYFPSRFTRPWAPFHREMLAAGNQPGRIVGIDALRGCGKTELLGRCEPIWRIENFQTRHAAWFCLNQTSARSHLDAILDLLRKSERLNQDYGKFEDETDDNGVTLTRKGRMVRLSALGLGQSIRGLNYRGFRPDMVVLDDVMDAPLYRNPERTRQVWDRMTGEAHGALADFGANATFRVLLNTFGPGDFPDMFSRRIAELKKDGLPAEFVLWRKYLKDMEDADAIWPGVISRELMTRIIALEGRSEANKNYFGIAEDPEKPFQQAYLNAYEAGDLPQDMAVCVGVDLSCSETEKGDYKAVVTVGRDDQMRYWVLDAWLRRGAKEASNKLLAERLFAVAEKFRPRKIRIETNGFQRFIIPILEAEEARRMRTLPIERVENREHKGDRILSMQPSFERGKWMFRRSEGDQDLLLTQLERFPETAHDDGPDAMQMAFEGLQGIGGLEIETGGRLQWTREFARRREGRGSFIDRIGRMPLWETA